MSARSLLLCSKVNHKMHMHVPTSFIAMCLLLSQGSCPTLQAGASDLRDSSVIGKMPAASRFQGAAVSDTRTSSDSEQTQQHHTSSKPPTTERSLVLAQLLKWDRKLGCRVYQEAASPALSSAAGPVVADTGAFTNSASQVMRAKAGQRTIPVGSLCRRTPASSRSPGAGHLAQSRAGPLCRPTESLTNWRSTRCCLPTQSEMHSAAQQVNVYHIVWL